MNENILDSCHLTVAQRFIEKIGVRAEDATSTDQWWVFQIIPRKVSVDGLDI